VPSEVSQVDIGELIVLIAEERADEIEAKGITIKIADDLGEVRASPTHMYQLFANLLTNVIQHNDSETPVIEVATLPAEAPEHHFLIRDNGSGIAEEDIDKVFLPFFKGAHGRTGIGLSTVSKLVSVYEGEVIAYNDNGACFELTIRDIDSSIEP
jgi:signal transduction histidine kinase